MLISNRPNHLPKDVQQRLIERRVAMIQRGDAHNWHRVKYKLDSDNNRIKLMTWIDTHTTGRFHAIGNRVFFENEQDALVFRLTHDCAAN